MTTVHRMLMIVYSSPQVKFVTTLHNIQIQSCEATYSRRRVTSCVTKASACHHTLNANHWYHLWEIPAVIEVKSNITTSDYVCRFSVNMFYFGRIIFYQFKHADIKGVS